MRALDDFENSSIEELSDESCSDYASKLRKTKFASDDDQYEDRINASSNSVH